MRDNYIQNINMINTSSEKQIGLDDFILLEQFDNEEKFIENLLIRYQADIIYVIETSFFLSKFKKLNIFYYKYLRPI